MGPDFIRQRITELRIQKGVSEFKMSTDLGHSRSYIQHIAAGRTLPSLQEFLYICDYLEVSPSEFFSEELSDPILVRQAYKLICEFDEEDLLALIPMLSRIKKK